MIIPTTILLTALDTVLFISLSSEKKQVCFEIGHEFAVENPQFLRSMGTLLGQQLLPGNRIMALQNGDEIFPAMFAAIHEAMDRTASRSEKHDES